MYTLSLVFSHDKNNVLMCKHEKQNALNFIGGHVKEMELPHDASYRELFEETGISRDDINLLFVRHETVTSAASGNTWSMYITTGILTGDVDLVAEKNELVWVPIFDTETFINAYGFGNCLVFLREAMRIHNIEVYP